MICSSLSFFGPHSAIPENFRSLVVAVKVNDKLFERAAASIYPQARIVTDFEVSADNGIYFQHVEGGELFVNDPEIAGKLNPADYLHCRIVNSQVEEWMHDVLVRHDNVTFHNCILKRGITKMKTVTFVECRNPNVVSAKQVALFHSQRVQINSYISYLFTDNEEDLLDLSSVGRVCASVNELTQRIDGSDQRKWAALAVVRSPLINIIHQERLSPGEKGNIILGTLTVEDARLIIQETTVDAAHLDVQNVHIPIMEEEFLMTEQRLLSECKTSAASAINLIGRDVVQNVIEFMKHQSYYRLFAAVVHRMKDLPSFQDWKTTSFTEELKASKGTCLRGAKNRLISSMTGYVDGVEQKMDNNTRMSFIAGHARKNGNDEIAALVSAGYSVKEAEDFMRLAE